MAASDNLVNVDVLVIGGGIGGVCAAIKAAEQGARVLIVEKADPRWGGQAPFAGGVFFCLFPDDDMDGWLKLNIEDGQLLNDRKWLRQYGEQTYPRLSELIKWGVPFKMDVKGGLRRVPLATTKHFHGSYTLVSLTPLIQVALTGMAVKKGAKFLNKTYIHELIVQDGKVAGAAGFHLATGEFHTFLSKSVILACGGCNFGVRRLFTMNYGEAISMAYQVGAEFRNAEFGNQYTPVEKETETWCWGNHLLENANGEKILAKHFPDSTREIGFETVMAMYKEITEGRGPIYYSFVGNPEVIERMQEIIGPAHNLVVHALKKGIDLSRERVEMKPCLSAHLGPIKTDLNCETTVPGLYAIGDANFGGCAFQGTLPAGSHPGYPLPFAVVSGCIAGERAGKKALKAPQPEANEKEVKRLKEEIMAPLKVKGGNSPYDGIHQIQEVISPLKYNFFKNESRLKEALGKIGGVRAGLSKLEAKDIHEVMRCHQVKSMALSAEMQYKAALMRTETRGGHIREDYSQRDDKNWLKWIIVRKEGEEMKLWTEPVPQV